jgi:hypothetical protein
VLEVKLPLLPPLIKHWLVNPFFESNILATINFLVFYLGSLRHLAALRPIEVIHEPVKRLLIQIPDMQTFKRLRISNMLCLAQVCHGKNDARVFFEI